MRKPVQVALIAVIVILAGATTALFLSYRKTSADYRDMKAAEETSRGRYERTINAIAEIQDSLDAIAPAGSKVSASLEAERQIAGPSGQKVLDRIAVLRASISRNKDRIKQLESSLSKSGMKVAGLQKMIANLKKDVAEKQELVANLSTQVDALSTRVSGLQTEVSQSQDTLRVRDETLEERRRELATVYYVIGNKKELEASGVIVAKGGVLGLGKTLQPSGDIATTATTLDTDQETVISLPSTKVDKVKVLSAQPASSYELRQAENGIELHILNPLEFRKVKQLVILTA